MSSCMPLRSAAASPSRRTAALATALWLTVSASYGQQHAADWKRMAPLKPRSYVCCQTPSPLAIDGQLDEPAWQSASWSQDFVDIEGPAKPPPRLRTRVKMLWDAQCFYLAAELEEPHVWAALREHDAVIFQDNDFEIFLDPDGDNHHYYELEINALNTTWDLFLPRPYKDGGQADDGWEIPGLRTAVGVAGTLNQPNDRDQGWTVEIALPWDAFRRHAAGPLPPAPGEQWRLNFSRVQWRHEIVEGAYRKVAGASEDNWVWSPQGIVDMHRPERWGVVEFASEPPPGPAGQPLASLEVRDTLMGVYHHQRDYHQRHRRWAARLEDLQLPGPLPFPVELTTFAGGFRAAAENRLSDGTDETWAVAEDSRLWQSTPTPTAQRRAILAVLDSQRTAWNQGDIPGFMRHYWNSESLSFSSGGVTVRGWQATLQRYQQRYPSRAKMGRLKFDSLEVTLLGVDAALVLGRWKLDYDDSSPKPAGGNFSLVLRRLEDRWQIVHDHTSADSPTPDP